LNEHQRLPRRVALAVARAWMGLSPRRASRAVEPDNSEAVIADRVRVSASFAWRVIDCPTLRLAANDISAAAPVAICPNARAPNVKFIVVQCAAMARADSVAASIFS